MEESKSRALSGPLLLSAAEELKIDMSDIDFSNFCPSLIGANTPQESHTPMHPSTLAIPTTILTRNQPVNRMKSQLKHRLRGSQSIVESIKNANNMCDMPVVGPTLKERPFYGSGSLEVTVLAPGQASEGVILKVSNEVADSIVLKVVSCHFAQGLPLSIPKRMLKTKTNRADKGILDDDPLLNAFVGGQTAQRLCQIQPDIIREPSLGEVYHMNLVANALLLDDRMISPHVLLPLYSSTTTVDTLDDFLDQRPHGCKSMKISAGTAKQLKKWIDSSIFQRITTPIVTKSSLPSWLASSASTKTFKCVNRKIAKERIGDLLLRVIAQEKAQTTLQKLLQTLVPDELTPVVVTTIFFQVIWTIFTAQLRIQDFRFNDLHVGNVFIGDSASRPESEVDHYVTGDVGYSVPSIPFFPMVADFGLASSEACPLREEIPQGVSSEQDFAYDYFTFAKTFRLLIKDRKDVSELVQMIDETAPPNFCSHPTNAKARFDVAYERTHQDPQRRRIAQEYDAHGKNPQFMWNIVRHPLFGKTFPQRSFHEGDSLWSI